MQVDLNSGHISWSQQGFFSWSHIATVGWSDYETTDQYSFFMELFDVEATISQESSCPTTHLGQMLTAI